MMKMFRMSLEDFLETINSGRKRTLKVEDLFSPKIELSLLKKIGAIFGKNLEYFIDPSEIIVEDDSSIFFRKEKFNTQLNLESKRIVSKFEELKHTVSALMMLSDIQLERKLPVYTISDNPKHLALELRSILYPKVFTNDLRTFLKEFIGSLSENNIIVFEFIETWNKKEKTNIDGFFLQPNFIVLKRNQKSFRREIFTLAHEIGHYLINVEEVEEVDSNDFDNNNFNHIEKWCNEFAFAFLAGENIFKIENLVKLNESNGYEYDLIKKISSETNLSRLAIYTKLFIDKKISSNAYFSIKNEIMYAIRNREEKEKLAKEKQKDLGRKTGGATPKPINSPIIINTMQSAYYEGLISEFDFCNFLKIQPKHIDKYLL